MSYKNLFLLFSLVAGILISCKKEDNYVPEKYADETVIYPVGIEDRDALLLSIRDYVKVDNSSTAEISVDFAFAEFFDKEFMNVGPVKLNGDSLVKTSAEFYVSNLDKNDFGLNPGTQNQWFIGGGNGFTTFNRMMEVKMPAKIVLESVPNSIALNTEVTLKAKNFPENAQAIIWHLKDVEGNFIQKETVTNELILSSSELSQLVPGKNSLIKVVAYSMERWENGGKQYVFLNEMVETAPVEFK